MYPRAALASVLLTACLGPQAEITPERAERQLDWMADAIPLCAAGTSAGTTRRSVSEMLELLRIVQAVETRKVARKDGTFDYPGACGGGMRYDYDHGGGVTTYALHFEDYCAHSEGGTPNLLRGGMRGKEIGQSTPDGPMISAFELDADLGMRFDVAPAELAQRTPWGGSGDGGTGGGGALPQAEGDVRLILQGLRSDYGNPSTWNPDPPTASAPDRTRVRRIRLEQDGNADALEIRDLVFESVGADNPETHIREGKLVGADGSWVSLSTPEDGPIQVDMGGGVMVGGTIRMEGTGDTTAELVVDLMARNFELSVNGEVADRGLDCAAAVPLMADIGAVVLSVMPELGR